MVSRAPLQILRPQIACSPPISLNLGQKSRVGPRSRAKCLPLVEHLENDFILKEEVTLDLGLIVMLVFAVRTITASDCNRELHRRYYSACKVKTQLLKNLGHDHLYLSELCCHQKTATECTVNTPWK